MNINDKYFFLKIITLQYLGPSPDPEFAGPGPEDRVRGPQNVAGPDLDRTVDSLPENEEENTLTGTHALLGFFMPTSVILGPSQHPKSQSRWIFFSFVGLDATRSPTRLEIKETDLIKFCSTE